MDSPRPTSDPDDLPEAYPPKRLIGEVPDRAPRPTSEPCPQCGGRGTEDHSWEAPTEACAGCKGTGVVCPTSDPPDGYQWDYLGPDPNDQDGEKWGWINEAGEVWTPPAVVPTSELAADVRADALIAECESHAVVLSMPHTPFQVEQSVNFLVSTVPHVIRALVARITDLEAQLETVIKAKNLWEYAAEERALVIHRSDARAEAAETQVAALTQERDNLQHLFDERARFRDEWKSRAEAAEAALATTRQALTEIAALEYPRNGDWPNLIELAERIARRTLTATEDTT